MNVNGRSIVPNANLRGANLSEADLSGASLSGANLSGANLSEADLSGANLSGANLSGVDLSRADLSEVDLYHANLCGANLSGANLRGVILSGTLIGFNHAPIVDAGSDFRGYRFWAWMDNETIIFRAGCHEWDDYDAAVAHYGPEYKANGNRQECLARLTLLHQLMTDERG